MARPEFDAFLSYAHEDKERVEWLARFLRSYWIPFRRRRRIFLDREHLAAGPLPDGLRRKLRASRYLIVCCSEDARKSSWVSQEIADFHAANGESYDNVRACRVGAPDDDAIPQELTPLDLYLPDLRSSDPKDRIASAAAVLAPLVGLDDAQQVLARRQRAFAAAAALAFLFITAGLARLWWLRTPAGVHHIVLQRVLDAAGSEPVLHERIGRAAEAVAATDGVDPMRRIALFVPEDIRPAILAAGYLSLPIPDCTAASRELHALPTMTGLAEKNALAVRALLLAQKHCGGTWIALARARSITTTALWPIELGESGLTGELRAIERSVAVKGWIEGEIALGIATRQPIVVSEQAVARWATNTDFEFTPEFVRRIELGDKLDDPAAVYFATLAVESIRETGYSTDGWNVWNLLAAAFAASGKRDQARMCMAEADRETVRWINGWGWRALALHRLGDGAGAETAFARAETDAAPSDSPAVWIDYVYTLAVTGQWERARRAAETAPNEQVRLLALCSLLELWAQRRPSGGVSRLQLIGHRLLGCEALYAGGPLTEFPARPIVSTRRT